MPSAGTRDRTPDKSARLEARVTPEQKALFQKAAAILGRSLTDFVVGSAQELATRTVREHEMMILSEHDRKVFVASLLEAPEPGPRLREAARRYNKTVRR